MGALAGTVELSDYGQYALSLLAVGLYIYRYWKKARDDAREVERLKGVQAKQHVDEASSAARTVAEDARSVAEMRSEVIEEQERQIGRLKRQVKSLEDERDTCREDLSELRERLKALEGRG